MSPLNREVDVAVLGAGPAGTAAATTAANHSLNTLVLDEALAPGGQVYRQPTVEVKGSRSDPDRVSGDLLRSQFANSAAEFIPGARVWSIVKDDNGYRIDAMIPAGSVVVFARAVLVASGAIERVVPFAGWTLPGVIGLAGATTLIKSQGLSPGKRVLVAGTGPLLFAVAANLLKYGVKPVAIVERNRRRDWLRCVPAMSARPKLLMRGLAWNLHLVRSRVPVLYGAEIGSARGAERVEQVTVVPAALRRTESASPTSSRELARFDVDAVAVGHGLTPSTEVTRMLGVEHLFDRELGGWKPRLDGAGRTSAPGLYIAGDCAGVLGADAARVSGELTALSVVTDLRGASMSDSSISASTVAYRRAARFGAAMSSLTHLQSTQVDCMEPDTIVCRCEDVRKADIVAAFAQGARDLNQLKHFTRCGMGPCQGRTCADVVGELLAAQICASTPHISRDSAREQVGYWTGRVPMRPLPLSELLGDFDYDDIPVPPPAPL